MASRGTTPTFRLMLEDETFDLTEALHVYVTFTQRTTELTKKDDDLTVLPHEIDVYLSQAETLKFKADSIVEVQANWTYVEGRRGRTKVINIKFSKNLIGSVIE